MIQLYRIHILRFVFFFLALIFFTLFQSSFVLHIMEANVAPQLWVILIAYLSIYHHFSLTVLMIYLTSLFYSTLTSFNFPQILILNSIIFLISQMSEKLNLKNAKIFFVYCALLTLVLPVAYWFITSVTSYEKNRSFDVIHLIAMVAFTYIFAAVIHFVFSKSELWIQDLDEQMEKRR